MKYPFMLMLAILHLLPGCKSVIEKNIVGMWKGTGTETQANNYKENKFSHQSEFTADGSFIETSFDITNGAPNPPVIYSYEIEGDSIIWRNNVGNKMLTRSHIEFISPTRLVYKSVVGDIVTIYDVNKIKE